MSTCKYKVTNAYRGEPVGDDAYTKFAFSLDHVSGDILQFEQTEACTEKGISVLRYGAILGFVEDEIATATFSLVGKNAEGTEYSATITIGTLATNTEITLETA